MPGAGRSTIAEGLRRGAAATHGGQHGRCGAHRGGQAGPRAGRAEPRALWPACAGAAALVRAAAPPAVGPAMRSAPGSRRRGRRRPPKRRGRALSRDRQVLHAPGPRVGRRLVQASRAARQVGLPWRRRRPPDVRRPAAAECKVRPSGDPPTVAAPLPGAHPGAPARVGGGRGSGRAEGPRTGLGASRASPGRSAPGPAARRTCAACCAARDLTGRGSIQQAGSRGGAHCAVRRGRQDAPQAPQSALRSVHSEPSTSSTGSCQASSTKFTSHVTKLHPVPDWRANTMQAWA